MKSPLVSRAQIVKSMALGSVALTIFAISCSQAPPEPSTPLEALQHALPVDPGMNVIVISFDALRADVLGTYGYPERTTPYLDAFAADSIVFENAYSVAPVTPTSFAAAFTGFLPTRVFHAWNLVTEDTLASRFTAAGYRTAAFVNNVQLTPERAFHTGFETYDMIRSQPDEVVLEKSVGWLSEHRDDQLFAWIHFLKPHAPYLYRPHAKHLYDESYEGEFLKTTKGRFETDEPHEIARIRSLYDGEVFHIDGIFGRLIEQLRTLGLLENSLIVVTSDHGEEFMEHGGFQHDRLTEEHVRVPLLIYHPKTRASLRTPILTSNVDFFPTLLSLAGIEDPQERDGHDLTTLTEAPRRLVGVSMTGSQERWLSMRKEHWKLIQTCMPEEAQTLYDLKTDPAEQQDLSSQRPDAVSSLYRELSTILGGDPCLIMQQAVQGKAPDVGLSDENIKALKALGYLGGE